jgi:ElaB/YqjD/DUF883 family membrane-anchored ribosome-binding protein
MQQPVNPSLQELGRETEQTRAGLTQTVDQLKTTVSKTASDLRHRISPEAIKAEVSDYVRSRGQQIIEDVTAAAHRNPMQAVAVGASVAYPLLRLARAIPLPRVQTPVAQVQPKLTLTQDIVMTSPTDRSIPELFGEAVGQLAKLVGNEFALARAELSEKMAQAGRAAAMIGAGAVIMIPALVLLLFAAAAALIRSGLSDPLAYLIAGGGAAIFAGALIAVGLQRLSGDALKPSLTLEQVQRDKLAAKEMAQ